MPIKFRFSKTAATPAEPLPQQKTHGAKHPRMNGLIGLITAEQKPQSIRRQNRRLLGRRPGGLAAKDLEAWRKEMEAELEADVEADKKFKALYDDPAQRTRVTDLLGVRFRATVARLANHGAARDQTSPSGR